MNLLVQRTVELPEGIYQPPPLRLELALGGLLFCVVATLWLIGRLSLASAVVYLALLSITAMVRAAQYRKFGALGPPTVSVAGGRLFIARPSDSRGGVSVALADLQHLVVYGPAGRRTYRLVKLDGTHVEAVPLWGAKLEDQAIRFLQRALPDRMTVEDPQTLFAAVRGDGPATERWGNTERD